MAEEIVCPVCWLGYQEDPVERRPMIICRQGHSACRECSGSLRSQRQCHTCRGNLLKQGIENRTLLEALETCKSHRKMGGTIPTIDAADLHLESHCLGWGAHTEVYRGKWAEHPIVVKMLCQIRGGSGGSEIVPHLKEEVRQMMELQHPNIVRVYGITEFPDQNRVGIVMEYFEHGNLRTFLTRSMMILSQEEKVGLCWDVVVALSYLHKKQAVHGDLKPENVLIYLSGDKTKRCYKAAVADFGISKLFQALDVEASIVGTPKYTAPELLEAQSDISGLADVFSLGIIMYKIFSGTTIFPRSTLSQVISAIHSDKRPSIPTNIPGSLRDIIQRSWKTAQTQRPSLDEIKQTLEPLLRSSTYISSPSCQSLESSDSTGNSFTFRVPPSIISRQMDQVSSSAGQVPSFSGESNTSTQTTASSSTSLASLFGSWNVSNSNLGTSGSTTVSNSNFSNFGSPHASNSNFGNLGSPHASNSNFGNLGSPHASNSNFGNFGSPHASNSDFGNFGSPNLSDSTNASFIPGPPINPVTPATPLGCFFGSWNVESSTNASTIPGPRMNPATSSSAVSRPSLFGSSSQFESVNPSSMSGQPMNPMTSIPATSQSSLFGRTNFSNSTNSGFVPGIHGPPTNSATPSSTASQPSLFGSGNRSVPENSTATTSSSFLFGSSNQSIQPNTSLTSSESQVFNFGQANQVTSSSAESAPVTIGVNSCSIQTTASSARSASSHFVTSEQTIHISEDAARPVQSLFGSINRSDAANATATTFSSSLFGSSSPSTQAGTTITSSESQAFDHFARTIPAGNSSSSTTQSFCHGGSHSSQLTVNSFAPVGYCGPPMDWGPTNQVASSSAVGSSAPLFTPANSSSQAMVSSSAASTSHCSNSGDSLDTTPMGCGPSNIR